MLCLAWDPLPRPDPYVSADAVSGGIQNNAAILELCPALKRAGPVHAKVVLRDYLELGRPKVLQFVKNLFSN